LFNAYGDTIFSLNLGTDYPDILRHVMTLGNTVPSRIGETKEMLDLRLELANPLNCIVGRKGFSKQFMHEEILQLLAGKYIQKRLAAITPKAAELITQATAYGPRTHNQLQFVAEELEKNPNSRRAVVYVGRHDDLTWSDSVTRAGEMPCTCIWQFHLRNKILDMAVYMRSWDLVWGLCYDIPSFVAVQMMLAKHLDVEVGRYVHTAGSSHIYQHHYDLEAWPTDDFLNLDYLIKDSVQATQAHANRLLTQTGHSPY